MAKQLLYPREAREQLGHWDPGGLMPDRYDRAICAAELRTRDAIPARIRNGRVPGWPFGTRKEPIHLRNERGWAERV